MLHHDTIAWYKRNVEIHGITMLIFAGFLYLSQASAGGNIGSFVYISLYSFSKLPADTDLAIATATLPWTFKFLIGMISDNLPIFGYNAKPYMVFMTCIGILATFAQGFKSLTPNFVALSWSLILMRFYGAFVDCLGDSLIIKSGKKDEIDSSSGLQSISWFSAAIGGGIFGIIATQLQTDDSQPDQVSVDGSRTYNLISSVLPVILLILLVFLKEEKTKINPGFKALGQQFVRLLVVFFSPPFIVLRTAGWIVLSKALNFSYSSGMQLFMVNEIKINPAIQGYISLANYAFLALGVVLYYRFFRTSSFRYIFGTTQFFIAIFTLSDYILVKQLNVKWGISNIVFLLATGNLYEIIGQLNQMPFLVMAGQLCPDNMEATFFALLMSVSNLGGVISAFIGSQVQSVFDIGNILADGKRDYSNFPTVVLINFAFVLSTLIFISLVPNTSALSPANADSLHPTNPYIIRLLRWAEIYKEPDYKIDETVNETPVTILSLEKSI